MVLDRRYSLKVNKAVIDVNDAAYNPKNWRFVLP
jgi:hypothetical protein